MTAQLAHCLIETLKSNEIAFCHWKSNFHLKKALSGGEDLDLLVDREDAQRFEGILANLGFKRAIDRLQVPLGSVFHFYGLDNTTHTLLHLHVYYRIVTGESLLKDYMFPLEKLYLQHMSMVEGVPVPDASAELILFIVRMMIKHASPIEYLLLRRGGSGYQAIREELAALRAADAGNQYAELLADWLPSIEGELFNKCRDALQQGAPFPYRFWLARRLRKQLKMYRRFSSVSALLLQTKLLLKHMIRRLHGGGNTKQLASGGAVIAFVGPEATGKSTLVKQTICWLGQVIDVSSAHLGKPPSTWLTFLPNLAVPLMRKIASRHRTSRTSNDGRGRGTESMSLLYSLRSVIDAWDRRALAINVQRRAANGKIVICDRYPSATVGAMDSARLTMPADKSGWRRLLAHLAALESQLYRQIPPPDAVIRLTVPVDVAIERNQAREKKGKEDDSYVLRRHMMGVIPVFPTAKTIELESNQPRAQTIHCVRDIVWNLL